MSQTRTPTITLACTTRKSGSSVHNEVTLQVPHEEQRTAHFEFTGDVLPDQPTTDGWALLAALPLAMQRGLNIHCHGTVDPELLANLEEFSHAWSRLHPGKYRRIEVSAETERSTPAMQGKSAVLAFSGGIDSLFTLAAHKTGLLGRRSLDVKTGVFLDVSDKETTEDLLQDLGALCASYGVPLTRVRTNIRSFTQSWSDAHVLLIACVLAQYEGVVSRGIISADFPYEDDIKGWGNNLATNCLVGSPAFPVTTSCAGWSRTQKVRAVSQNPEVRSRLRVCYSPERGTARNCGRCDKCMRTYLNFLSAGFREIPALGPPPSERHLRTLRADTPVRQVFYKDLLHNGDWSQAPHVPKLLRRILRRKSSPWQFAKRWLAPFSKRQAKAL